MTALQQNGKALQVAGALLSLGILVAVFARQSAPARPPVIVEATASGIPKILLGARPFADIENDRSHWPAKVAMRFPVSVKLVDADDSEIGQAILRVGLVLDVAKVNADGILELRRGSIRCRVDHAATNFLEGLH